VSDTFPSNRFSVGPFPIIRHQYSSSYNKTSIQQFSIYSISRLPQLGYRWLKFSLCSTRTMPYLFVLLLLLLLLLLFFNVRNVCPNESIAVSVLSVALMRVEQLRVYNYALSFFVGFLLSTYPTWNGLVYAWSTKSINQWISQLINKPINQLINQTISKSISKSINQSIS
jgi:hypothetical protein